MGQKLEDRIPLMLAAVCAALLGFPRASAQATVSLSEQLRAQYKLVKMGSDTSGPSVIEPGTLLEIKKGGILGVPYSDASTLSTKYEGGTVQTPSNTLSKGIGFAMKKLGKEQTTHLMQVGDKVYPSKVDVNLTKDTVSLGIVECDTCNKTDANKSDPPTYDKAVVVFEFPKGTLAKASAGDVEDTIGQLLAISEDSQDQGGQQQGQNGQGEGQGGGGQEQQAEPQTIEKGQTPDQVQAALGKPDKIVNLGAKQLYIYKDLKVTFVNGKVTDVQ